MKTQSKISEKLKKELKLDWINSDIDNFDYTPSKAKVKLINFNRHISSEHVISELNKQGLRPATLYELAQWAKKNDKEAFNRAYLVVALGSVWRSGDGDRHVPGLGHWSAGRELNLSNFDGDWLDYYRFAAIKKVSSYNDKLAQKILTNIDEVKECWVWKGAKRKGYGLVRVHNKESSVHRVLYELLVAPIPKGYVIDHLCRNKSCVNPAHLQPVTSRENTIRGTGPTAINSKKTHCPKGHLLSGDNLSKRKDGKRACKQCNRGRNIK